MKLLVFAHIPPPHHGQSYMVQLMLAGFGGDHRKRRLSQTPATESVDLGVECYHVNARVSKQLEDIGDFRLGKFLLLLGYCLQAIWCRFRYGVRTLYYIPAPGKHSALYRDWIVMMICRPFFRRVILHWHAAGLAKWLETSVQIRSRSMTFRALKSADLSIVLSNYNRADAEKLFPRRIQIVSNGIPDPCPAFETDVLPRRKFRRELRSELLAGKTVEGERAKNENPGICNVLFLAHCMREKGLFDAVEGVLLANRKLAAQNLPLTFHLHVAGNFVIAQDKEEFDRRLAAPEAANRIWHLGFVSGDQKNRLLRDCDFLCFPTYYQNENQPVNLIEAMAYGLPIVTTRWRSLPEMFPPDYPGLTDIRSPEGVADSLIHLATGAYEETFRRVFLRSFNIESYLSGLAEAFKSLDRTAPEIPAETLASVAR